MSTLRTISPATLHRQARTAEQSSLSDRYIAFADRQKPYRTAWFLASLLAHSCFLVPLSFLVIYSLNGPLVVPFLAISMVLFFLNIVANMGGMSTRVTIFLFGFSAVAHVLMVASTLLMV